MILWFALFFIGGYLLLKIIKAPKNKKHQKEVDIYRSEREEDDDRLTTIHLPPLDFSTKRRKDYEIKIPGRWIEAEEEIEIHGKKIAKGFFYYGESLYCDNGYYEEPSLVNPFLIISDVEYQDTNGLYWPSYNRFSPDERASYLSWLASDRDNANCDISYVFVYFYGLERRSVLDYLNGLVTDQEFINIFQEVKRLNSIYGSKSHSFLRYSYNLMGVMYLLRPDLISLEDLEVKELEGFLFKIKLASYVVAGKDIPSNMAYEWLVGFGGYYLRTPARRCHKEFRRLFDMEFSKRFPLGFKVKPNKRPLKLVESFGNITISPKDIDIGFLPDVTSLRSPINKHLIPIAELCTEKLESYSRYVGQKEGNADEIAALFLLPEELLRENDLAKELKREINSEVTRNDGLVSIATIWSKMKMKQPTRMNKREVEILTKIANFLGYEYAPNEQHYGIKVKPTDNVVFYSLDEESPELSVSSEFHYIALSLRLGAIVASTDGVIDPHERNYLSNLIDKNNKLAVNEKISLKAFLTWCLHSDLNMLGIKSKVAKLSSHEIDLIRSIIINVVLADGISSPDEIKQVEKIYRSLGLDSQLVIKDIHELSTLGANTKLNPTLDSEQPEVVSINYDALAEYKKETHDVQEMLGNIFKDDSDELEDDIEDHVKEDTSMESNHKYQGLESIYIPIYEELIKKEEWELEDIKLLESKFNVMMNGAIESINDWAFELVGEAIIRENGPYYIDLEIVEEVEEELQG